MKTTLLWIAGIALVLLITIGVYFIGRQINYALSYEDMVRDTIREMVDAEVLKEME